MNKRLANFWICKCILIYILHSGVQAQSTDSVLVFKVRDPAMEVSVFPDDSVFWTERVNHVTIRIRGEKKLGGVFLKGGKLFGADTNYAVFVSEKDLSAQLTVYEILPDGSKAVCFTRKYTIRQSPQPVLKVCGVKADSVLDLWDLHIRNEITASIEGQKQPLRVNSFSMVSLKDGKNDTLFTKGCGFSLPMREQLFKLAPGSVITLCGVEVLYPGGKSKVLPPIQIFLAETGKRRVGY